MNCGLGRGGLGVSQPSSRVDASQWGLLLTLICSSHGGHYEATAAAVGSQAAVAASQGMREALTAATHGGPGHRCGGDDPGHPCAGTAVGERRNARRRGPRRLGQSIAAVGTGVWRQRGPATVALSSPPALEGLASRQWSPTGRSPPFHTLQLSLSSTGLSSTTTPNRRDALCQQSWLLCRSDSPLGASHHRGGRAGSARPARTVQALQT